MLEIQHIELLPVDWKRRLSLASGHLPWLEDVVAGGLCLSEVALSSALEWPQGLVADRTSTSSEEENS